MNIFLQIAVSVPQDYEVPEQHEFQQWLDLIIQDEGEVCVRIVDEAESIRLNQHYRGNPYATNVLSFPLALPLLGDIVITAPLIKEEAIQQGKEIKSHWAHIFIHGILHLQGHDHQTEEQARRMENYEINLMNQLGFSNPYLVVNG